MKHIDKKDLHGGAGLMLRTGIKANDVNRSREQVKRKTLSLPIDVYNLASEISFREEKTLKMFVINALTELLHCGITEYHKYDFSSTAHPSVFLPYDIAKQLRQLAHDNKKTERLVITEALVQHIQKQYINKYPDILEITK